MHNEVVKFCAFALIGLNTACNLEFESDSTSNNILIPSRARWHNNQGAVYMDQHNYTRGRQEFEQAIKLASQYPIAYANLGIALYSLGKYDSAAIELNTALHYDNKLLSAHYTLGLIHNAQGKDHEKALSSLELVAKDDPDDPHVRYYLGQVKSKLNRNEEAIADFQETIRLDPFNVSAYYGLANILRRSGNDSAWRETLEKFNELSQAGFQGVSSSYQGQGRYAEVVTDTHGGDAGEEDQKGPFTFAKPQLIHNQPNFATAIDIRNNGSNDILVGSPMKIYLEGVLESQQDLPKTTKGFHALPSDFNNDHIQDLIISGSDTQYLQGNKDGSWSLKKVLPKAQKSVSADVDHDGDLDLLLSGQTNTHLLANDGTGNFFDITDKAGISSEKVFDQVIFSDFDNDRDIDFFTLSNGSIELYTNNRDGTFTDISKKSNLPFSGIKYLLIEDINQDGFMDCIVLNDEKQLVHFTNRNGLKFTETQRLSDINAHSLVSSDLDNDGDLDLWCIEDSGIKTIAWHAGSWEPTEASIKLSYSSVPVVASDLDRDGRIDLWAGGNLVRNITDSGNWVRIDLTGLNSNRDGIGTKIEIKTENRLQKRELRSNDSNSDLMFGLASSDSIEFLRILWPGGVRQTELATKANQEISLKELDRKGTSCPILYAWDGSSFRFITDILGGAIIGYQTGIGTFYYPDSDEYVPLGKIQPLNGNYTIKLTNQLEEVIYIDALELIAIDHTKNVTIYPNERLLSSPPYPKFKLYSLSNFIIPKTALDNNGNSILDKIKELDDRWYDDFGLTDIHGYAELHHIELTWEDLSSIQNPVLLGYGWVDYAHSTSNWSASQRGLNLSPPKLEVGDGKGGWKLVTTDMGNPAGLPKHMVYDLKNVFSPGDYRLRITTNAAIYWDQIVIGENVETKLSRKENLPTAAKLLWRGYPKHTPINKTFAFRYHYDQLNLEAPWGTHSGAYTRLGPVTDLVQKIDNQFVIMRHGDELSVEFSESLFPKVAKNSNRSFLLHAVGFGKDMDFHSANSLSVGPLPFHGMSSYPYPQTEHYPQSEANLQYIQNYNTRRVKGYYR
ncbi:MAG: FG-GAP-like repeat-containing protein [Candidatus Latescibacterota bacterium]|nr:FG-GAP-like repeat-containing protein [Candidatus Latescibacterota bacterium]